MLVSESPADTRREHLRKISVNGEPAELDRNIVIEPLGTGDGSVVRILEEDDR